MNEDAPPPCAWDKTSVITKRLDLRGRSIDLLLRLSGNQLILGIVAVVRVAVMGHDHLGMEPPAVTSGLRNLLDVSFSRVSRPPTTAPAAAPGRTEKLPQADHLTASKETP